MGLVSTYLASQRIVDTRKDVWQLPLVQIAFACLRGAVKYPWSQSPVQPAGRALLAAIIAIMLVMKRLMSRSNRHGGGIVSPASRSSRLAYLVDSILHIHPPRRRLASARDVYLNGKGVANFAEVVLAALSKSAWADSASGFTDLAPGTPSSMKLYPQGLRLNISRRSLSECQIPSIHHIELDASDSGDNSDD